VLAGVRNEADAADLASAGGANMRALVLDITDPDHLAALPGQIGDKLDAVVNNAGFALDGPIETIGLDALRRQYEVNVVGHVAVTQAVLPLLRANHGRVLFVSSLSGRLSTPLTGADNSSKFAIEAYLRIGFRITGRAVAKGPGRVVTTPMRFRLPAAKAGRRRRAA